MKNKHGNGIGLRFWVSMRRKDDCLFSRRNGYTGKLFLGYSVCVRLFGKNIL